jgi:hypothetical protein
VVAATRCLIHWCTDELDVEFRGLRVAEVLAGLQDAGALMG